MAQKRLAQGLHVPRHFTRPGHDGTQGIAWSERDIRIHGADGQVVFRMDGVEVPEGWSDLAAQILASKYLRGSERSARQSVARIVGAIVEAGLRSRYFATPRDADHFAAELTHLLLHQKAAFNSPVWFNVGHAAPTASSKTHFVWRDGEAVSTDAYVHPQASACFIQSIQDNLVGPDGIFDLLRKEARLFKYGSGTGTNFSPLRSRFEALSGGGSSSGLMSFLRVFDAAAAATKSGGTTRRAAKMVCLDADHPEILDFIDWKLKEERKARALIAHGYASEWESEAYASVSGQNANNAVRLTDAFMDAVQADRPWQTHLRDGTVHETLAARDVWKRIAAAAWACADPGIQFHDTINKWHTCKASGDSHASNPCSEYMFLDDSACNLASLNLLAFGTDRLDVESFQHAVRILLIAQDILVGHAGYPTEQIARNSTRFRPLGLGYANLGALCMVHGAPYDSPEGRGIAAAVTSLLGATAYLVSAEMAHVLGAFDGIEDEAEGTTNRQHMTRVLQMHAEAAAGLLANGMDGLVLVPDDWTAIAQAGHVAWQAACSAPGWRNAQTTVLAPTGTIALLMDCDTTGIEPDFSLVKTKHMAGGGVFRIINQSAAMALQRLGYNSDEVTAIMHHALGSGSLDAFAEALVEAGFSKQEVQAACAQVEATGRFDETTAGVSPSRMLEAGFTADQVGHVVQQVEGHHHFEGSALRPEHQAIFDCASPQGTRSIQAKGHVAMMAAVQPFLSGAISKTINLPHTASQQDVQDVFWSAWQSGLKAVALYRDGSKASQPLANRQAAGTSDSPPCPVCGQATVRSGSCFRCQNCGTSMGCS